MAKIQCGKTRNLSKGEKPYEVWSNGVWKWYVLKKYQSDDTKPYARAFCKVFSPYTPSGELGDVYLEDIRNNAELIETNY